MPNYEYLCPSCGHLFEIWQPVGEAAPPCEVCASVVKKVFHPPRVIFKGSGFYVTDLRAEKEKSSSSSNSKSGDSSAKSEGESASSSSDSTTEKPSSDKSDKSEPKSETAPAAPTSKAADSTGAS